MDGGVQKQLGSRMVVEANYVGSKGMNLFRMVNVNQMDLNANGFVRDFQAAQRNLAATGNPNIGESTGNYGRLYGGTIPTAAYGDIRNGNVASSRTRSTAGRSASPSRAPGCPTPSSGRNPQFTVAGEGCSCSSSWYNGLQIQVRGRIGSSLNFAANYTFSKSIDDLSHDTNGAGTNIIVPSDPKRPR